MFNELLLLYCAALCRLLKRRFRSGQALCITAVAVLLLVLASSKVLGLHPTSHHASAWDDCTTSCHITFTVQ